MSDYRENLCNDVMEELMPHFSSGDLGMIRETMTKVLADYEVSERCTKIVVRDNHNDRLLKQYSACLYVDGKSEKTVRIYCRILKRFAEFLGVPLEKVGTYDIRYYLASMKETGVSDRTLENYRSYISAFFQWMSREDIIDKNPAEKILPIKYKEEIRLPFKDTEIDALRSACDKVRDRALLEVLLSSGIRVDELINLNVEDIDFKSRAIHVREGKGKKERITYMTEVCAGHLQRYLEERNTDTNVLFLGIRTKGKMTTGGVRNALRCIGEKAGVENVHPHRFRRTFATNLARRGMEVQTIARLMGHTNMGTTMIYVHEDDSRIINDYRKYTA